jgi:hypothetical protein
MFRLVNDELVRMWKEAAEEVNHANHVATVLAKLQFIQWAKRRP